MPADAYAPAASKKKATSKTPASKSKKPAGDKPSSAPVQYIIVPRKEVGVKESLVWRSNSAKKPQADMYHTQPDIFIPRKAELGRATQRGYNLPEDGVMTDKAKDTNGTVIEALRGWPSLQPPPQKPLSEQYSEQAALRAQWGDTTGAAGAQKKKAKRSKKKKEEEPLVIELDESQEPYLPELMAHRFLYENLVREAEERRARKAAEAGEDEEEGDGTIEVRTNRAAQLRAIHLGHLVKVAPKDLWQMRQFKDGARTQLDTFRRAQRKA